MLACKIELEPKESWLQLLEGDYPGKIGGAPGDAFELVYTSVTNTVRERMHAVDPVLAEYIRRAVLDFLRKKS